MTLDETFKAAKAGDLTNDTTYKVGEISRKTGLQKQPDGSWAPPKGQAKSGGAGIPKADEKTFVGKTFKDFSESARASGYKPAKETENPDGSSSTFFSNGDKQIRVDFDKSGKITKVQKETENPAASEENKRLTNVPGQTAAENLQQWENSVKTEARNLGENQVLLQNSMGDVVFYSEGNDEKIDQAEARGYKKMSLVRPDGSVKRHQTNNPASSETKSKMKPESSNMGYDWSHGRYTAPKDLSNAAPQDIAKELQTLNATGRLGRIKTKEGGSTHGKNYFNSTHTTFDIKKIDEEYVYIDNREGTWKVPLNEIEMIQGWHDYGKRDPETGEVTPLRPDPITDAAYTAESVNAPRENLERKLTGDCKIRIRK